MTLAPGLRIAPNAPLVFVLDRTASMATRDCPEGLSRWDYARGAVREAILHARRQGRRVTLITFGRGITVYEDATHLDVDDLFMGDNACWTGQAASEALWFAAARTNGAITSPAGGVVIISDGMPDMDTRVGEVLLSSNVIMRELFAQTVFLTVGRVPMDVQLFASLWPHHARLEDAAVTNRLNGLSQLETVDFGAEKTNAETTRGGR